jgi:hypothetical protein
LGRSDSAELVALRPELAKERTEAAEIVRGLIDRIVLTPKKEDGRKSLSVDLEGALALAVNDERPLAGSGLSGAVTTVVAGAGLGLCALFVAPGLMTLGQRM